MEQRKRLLWGELRPPTIKTEFGQLLSFMPEKTHVGNDGSQGTADVPRRRNRSEKIYKAGAQRLVTPTTPRADRPPAVSEIELALSTHTCLSRFSCPLTGVLCKPPFAELLVKIRIRRQRSLQDFYQRREQDCSRPAAFKNATVRERPTPAAGDFLATDRCTL
jgi:hypothetical protein